MAARHVTDEFSALYDGDLGPEREAAVREHLASCADCAEAFTSFRQAIDTVRALPREPMPRRVPVPQTAPVREAAPRRFRLPSRWIPRRYVPGMATGVALLAAIAIVVIATRGGGTSSSTPPSGGGAQTGSAALAACGGALPRTDPGVPASFQHVVTAGDAARPGQELLVASDAAQVTAGTGVSVVAQFSFARTTAAAPGASSVAPLREAVQPCLSVSTVASAASQAASIRTFRPEFGPDASVQSMPSAVITVPSGLPPGTQIDVTATVPPGFPDPGDPPLTADLVLTVR